MIEGFGSGSIPLSDQWIRIRIREAQKHVDPDPELGPEVSQTFTTSERVQLMLFLKESTDFVDAGKHLIITIC